MVTKLFWEEKVHAASGRAQAGTQGSLLFFLLSLGGRGGAKDFFSFFPHSKCVPNMFPLSIQ
jgi:hypothetical protein